MENMNPGDAVLDARRSILAGTRMSGLFAAIAGGLAIVVGTFASRDASAYSLGGPNWASGNPVMQLELGNPGRTLLDGNTTWNTASRPALDMCNDALRGMQFGRAMNCTAAVACGHRVNPMAW